MSDKKIIKDTLIINEGKSFTGNVLIEGELIKDIFEDNTGKDFSGVEIIDGKGKILIPGVIDDQVHFREPGLTHKGDINSESKAAAAGGVTTYMEMPNTSPKTTTRQLLEEKYSLASEKSLVNYSFYIGATNDNLEEILRIDLKTVCGIKVFMGSSTGNMLVNDPETLKNIFSQTGALIAVHCEDEEIIQKNSAIYKEKYKDDIPVSIHPLIRNHEACYKSTSFAVDLATRYNSRLHVLHLSTARELGLFDKSKPAEMKRITSEVCVHHLWFDDRDYEKMGTKIKWNPAIKSQEDRKGLFKGLLENKIDIIATDHAPHTTEEKNNSYFNCPSGGPLVQHSLVAMLEFYHRKEITLEKIVEKMCHAPAKIFKIDRRGFIRKGYYADLVLVDLNKPLKVSHDNILYKCGWSPFDGYTFHSGVTHTLVNGEIVWQDGNINDLIRGKRILFTR